MSGDPEIGGGTNSRPLRDPIGQTARGVPDESVGPEQRTIPEQLENADGEGVAAMAEKLAREAQAFRRGLAASPEADVAAEDDPTGHA